MTFVGLLKIILNITLKLYLVLFWFLIYQSTAFCIAFLCSGVTNKANTLIFKLGSSYINIFLLPITNPLVLLLFALFVLVITPVNEYILSRLESNEIDAWDHSEWVNDCIALLNNATPLERIMNIGTILSFK